MTIQNTNRPNFVVFMTDQQLGDTQLKESGVMMPHLEKLKRNGVTFERAYCTAPHCCPSRASFFTGLYPTEHGVWNNIDLAGAFSHGVFDGVKLFSEDLKEAGYQLFYNGKWHVSIEESPAERGFEKDGCPFPLAGHYEKWQRRPDMRDWDYFEEGKFSLDDKSHKEGVISRPGYPAYALYGEEENPYEDRNVVEHAISQLEQIDENRPFFLYIGVLGPHDPYFLPKEYLDKYPKGSVRLPDTWDDPMEDKPGLYRRTKDRFSKLSREEQEEALRHYMAFCTYEDDLFGMILDAMEAKGLLKDTVVLYVSDHGDYAGAHGLWTKGLPCFEEAYHICSVMGYGNIKEKGKSVKERISLVDYAPTFLEMAGIRREGGFSGSSLLPFLKGQKPADWRKEIYTQSNGNETYGIQRSIFADDYHFVFNDFDYDELYDMKKDPHCLRNLARKKEYEPVIREFYKKMWRFAYEHKDTIANPYITTAMAQYGPGIIKEV